MDEALFDLEPAGRAAAISPDGAYRYSLHREWRRSEDQPRWVTFVMLNPSTADAVQDDPTIRRCIAFARALGGTGLAVANLYAFRATSPADLWAAAELSGLRPTVLGSSTDPGSPRRPNTRDRNVNGVM